MYVDYHAKFGWMVGVLQLSNTLEVISTVNFLKQYTCTKCKTFDLQLQTALLESAIVGEWLKIK